MWPEPVTSRKGDALAKNRGRSSFPKDAASGVGNKATSDEIAPITRSNRARTIATRAEERLELHGSKKSKKMTKKKTITRRAVMTMKKNLLNTRRTTRQ